MKRIIRIFVLDTLINVVFVCYAFTDTINIPADYATIQAGINAASNGDTVLVQPGTYVENINYNGKNITVASLFYTTHDTSYISQTIIDGNQNGSVVTFENGEYYTAVLSGFVIMNGYAQGNFPDYNGGGIYCGYTSSPSLENIKVLNNTGLNGGGVFSHHYSSPFIRNVLITDNIAYERGGGICCWDYSFPRLENVIVKNNTANVSGGGIFCYLKSYPYFNDENRCNIFNNTVNSSKGNGEDIFSFDCNMIDIIVDTFTVLIPSDYYASPIDNFTFDILHGAQSNLINSDVYVSIEGDDSNSGISADDPFKTIKHALSVIYSDSLNSNTIHLASGVYSDSTNGETFPIKWSNNVNLQGSEGDETILDANNTSRVLDLYYVYGALIKDVILRNGQACDGGGIYCWNSCPIFQNVTISGNNASRFGGGIFCWLSQPMLKNIIITGNSAEYDGGGIYLDQSSPILDKITITNNSASYGSGIYCFIESSPILINSIITQNTGSYGLYILDNYMGNPSIAYSDFYNNEGGNFYGVNDSIGINVTTNANGDSCDVFYNIQLDPLFVDPANGDYHLSWVHYPIHDSTMSPCIDAGDPNSPPDPDSTIADMGAFYFNQNVSVDDPQEISNYMFTNYPNPISSYINNLTVSFSIHKPGKVKIQLFNIKGQLVSTLLDEEKNIGEHTISITVDNLSSGIYFTNLIVDGVEKEVSKVVVLR